MPLGSSDYTLTPLNDEIILSMHRPAVFGVSFTVGKLTCRRAVATDHPAPRHRIGLFENRAFGERILRPKARVPLAAAALGFLVPLICRGILPPPRIDLPGDGIFLVWPSHSHTPPCALTVALKLDNYIIS